MAYYLKILNSFEVWFLIRGRSVCGGNQSFFGGLRANLFFHWFKEGDQIFSCGQRGGRGGTEFLAITHHNHTAPLLLYPLLVKMIPP